jgi:hypothetical protein
VKFYDLETAPNVFDIVWCKWPRREDAGRPGPWVRPVLVLDKRLMLDERDQTAWMAITAAYGTGLENVKPAEVAGNILIPTAKCHAAGLHKATIFKLDLNNRKRLPWAEEYFVPQEYVRSQKIIVGSLDADQQRLFHACFQARGFAFPLP